MTELAFHNSWVESLTSVEFTQGVYPEDAWGERKWMGRVDGKTAIAPWSSWDAPAVCNNTDCPADRADDPECDCNAQLKWSWEGHYRTGPDLEIAFTVPEWNLDGACFIQQEDDGYLYVDFDKVIDEQGRVHPTALAYLAHLGPTYCDISVSETGLHALYTGELPIERNDPSWKIGDEAWGELDKPPAIEIFGGKRVLATTGKHVDGSPDTARPVNEDALEAILKANGYSGRTCKTSANLRSTTKRTSWGALSREDSESAVEHDETDDPEDVMIAVDRLDARRVAGETIVKEWTDKSRDIHSFLPVWGSASDRGTANIVSEVVWKDTGHESGYGGPVEMAAIDLGLLSHDEAAYGCVSGWDWVRCVRHLHELGFRVPKLISEASGESRSPVEIVLDEVALAWRSDPDVALAAWLRARETNAELFEGAQPPIEVLRPILRELTGEATNTDAVSVAVLQHATAILEELDPDTARNSFGVPVSVES